MCTSCLVDTVLHKGRCYACPLADIARVAIKQEEEKKAETASRRKKHTTRKSPMYKSFENLDQELCHRVGNAHFDSKKFCQ